MKADEYRAMAEKRRAEAEVYARSRLNLVALSLREEADYLDSLAADAEIAAEAEQAREDKP